MAEIPDIQHISGKEARDALKDPEKGSLRVLKALGRQMDFFSAILAQGENRLEVKNEFEMVAAEAIKKAYIEEAELEGLELPVINIVKF